MSSREKKKEPDKGCLDDSEMWAKSRAEYSKREKGQEVLLVIPVATGRLSLSFTIQTNKQKKQNLQDCLGQGFVHPYVLNDEGLEFFRSLNKMSLHY